VHQLAEELKQEQNVSKINKILAKSPVKLSKNGHVIPQLTKHITC